MAQSRAQILFWSTYSKVYDGLLGFQPYSDLIREATGRLHLNKGAVVADLGCGTANCLGSISEGDDSATFTMIGVDSSPQMMRAARRKFRGMRNVELVEQSLLTWLTERDPASVDNIVSVNVLYTMRPQDRAAFWSGISRVLRPGGNAVVVTTDRPGIGPVAREHLANAPFRRLLSFRLAAVLILNMFIWFFESNDVYDPASLETLIAEANMAGLDVTATKRCYGGEENGVDVLLEVESSVTAALGVAV